MADRLRETLADAGRVLAMEGHGDYVAGHISVRLPEDSGRFLMKPAGIGIEEMRPDNIITVDIEGKKVDGTMPRHNEVFIHSEVLRARSDVQCVIHSHPIHAVAFSSLGKPLVAVSNAAGYFADGRLPIFSETTDLIINQERGKAVARCLGGHAALILRNHGIVATGGSIAEAVWCAIKLEKACQAQLLAEAAGGQNSSLTARTSTTSAAAPIGPICTTTRSATWCGNGAARAAARSCRRRTSPRLRIRTERRTRRSGSRFAASRNDR
jgi:L-ribulose-5-phosphate 4-epimerase